MPDGDRVQNGNVALLIDADNASAGGLDQTLTILAELGAVNVRRAYGNWSKPGLKSWVALIQKYAIEPQQQFDITKGKNATDMKMTIDAMDLLYSGRVDGFGIMSSDSDFMPIAMRIRQNGLPVYGFGTSRTPEGFRQACTRFIDLNAAEQTASEPDDKTGVAPPVGDDLVKLLGDALKASKRDESGFASISEVGRRASARSSFDARSYGFQRLSDLVQSLAQFQTERRNGELFMKRLR
ncbi:NYN domain-containing protein [Novosphingobium sp. Gsoil 351]|uniref:NYN domain-containing protein n=1 Tax=Novosphingobium sp. Gsoil 351 TaxID=2675225 RepID=UPI0012B4AD1B|nr:NYN domain-containing protein [Novosphingobium sp. Gsoil 351]QGN53901.1 NYN domain-containing protein [Novosphingobium sp. Gsoil 351]